MSKAFVIERFGLHQPPSLVPRATASAEIERLTQEYLSRGGSVQQVEAAPYRPYRMPVLGRSMEHEDECRRRGGQTTKQARQAQRRANRGMNLPQHLRVCDE